MLLTIKDRILFDDNFDHQKKKTNFKNEKEALYEQDEEVLQSMIKNNQIDSLYEEIFANTNIMKEDELGPFNSNDMDVESKTMNTLIDYLKPESLDRIRLPFEEIYNSVENQMSPLKGYVLENRERIEEIIDTFISRMILEMLTLDKVGFKLESMIKKVRDLFHMRKKEYVSKVNNDFENYDEVNEMISNRCKEASDYLHDKLFARCSAPKKRGRRNKLRAEEELNDLEVITSDYITSMKATSVQSAKVQEEKVKNRLIRKDEEEEEEEEEEESKKAAHTITVDQYPAFSKVLSVLNKSLPKTNNHGWFLNNILRGIRELDSKGWPLHTFVKIANNMQYCVHAKRVIIRDFDESTKRYYSAFTGAPIRSGQTVTWIKIVENDASRLQKEDEDDKILIDRAFDSIEFKRSVAAFYVETEICSLASVFNTDFSDEYKDLFPEHFGKEKSKKKKNKRKDSEAKAGDKKEEEEIKRELKKPKLTKVKKETSDTKEEEMEVEVVKVKKESVICDKPNRHASDHPLWHIMHNIGRTIKKIDLDQYLWHCHDNETKRKNYRAEREKTRAIFDQMSDSSFKTDFEKIITYFMETSPFFDVNNIPIENRKTVIDDCFNTILDFVDVLFTQETEKKKTMKKKEKNTMIRNLFISSDSRLQIKGRKNVFMEKKNNGVDLTHILFPSHYPFLFIILFDYMCDYKNNKYDLPKTNCDPNYRYDEGVKLLNALSITINT